jgi:hypothetical protein
MGEGGIQMASEVLSSTIESVAAELNIDKRLDDIKRRSRLMQALSALVLLGAAAIALLVTPTTAIVFAALAVVGLWMLPTVRRTVGETFGIRDRSGKYRMVAASDDGTFLAFLDDGGKPRLLLGVGATGTPFLAMFDASAEMRLSAACDTASNAAVIDLPTGNGDISIQTEPGADPFIKVSSQDGRITIAAPGRISGKKGEALAVLQVDDRLAEFQCSRPGALALLAVRDELTGTAANVGDERAVCGVLKGKVVTGKS